MSADITAFVGVDGAPYVMSPGAGANGEENADLYRMDVTGRAVEQVKWSDIADSWPYVSRSIPLGMLPEKLRNLAHNLLAMRAQAVPLYMVTGVGRNGKRFSFKARGAQAFCYNLWRGHVWQIDEQTGKRTRVKTYHN